MEKPPKLEIRVCPPCNAPGSEVKDKSHVGHVVPLAPGIHRDIVDVTAGLPVEDFVSQVSPREIIQHGQAGTEE